MNIPNLFIVGQSKSGTSALYSMLKEHPEIFASPVKEPCYFCKDLIRESDTFHKRKAFFDYRDKEVYLKLFSKVRNEKVISESSTLYLYSRDAAEEIWNLNPNAKIIMILRDPVSYVISLHNEHFRKAQENVDDFERTILLEKDRREGNHIPPHCLFPSSLFYSDRIKYAEQIARFQNKFGESNTKVIIYEDFKADNSGVFRKILEFLDVDPEFIPKIKKQNISGSPRFPKLNTLIMSSSLKRRTQQVLPDSLYSVFKPLWRKLLWKKKNPANITENFKKHLKEQYKPEVEKLSNFLNIDLLKKWNY